MSKYFDQTGFTYFWGKLKALLGNKVDKVSGKGLSTNDYTTAEKTKLGGTNVAYGTCATAAATAAKVITISGNTNWALAAGSIIIVKFSYTNTAANPTFNVNGTGAKSVLYNTAVLTTSSLSYAGYANRYGVYVYDGTRYVFVGWSVDTNTTYSNASLGQGYGTCATAESTVEKVVTLSSYTLTKGGVVAVKFTYGVPASATMNINSKGAKAIFYKGAAIAAGVIKAGDVGVFIYDGTQYHLIAIDRAASIAATPVVNDLSSTSTTSALSAAQGKALKALVDGKVSRNNGTITLTASGWTADGSGFTQTVASSVILGSGDIFVGPAAGSEEAWGVNAIRATGHQSGKLIFHAEEKPAANVSVQFVEIF